MNAFEHWFVAQFGEREKMPDTDDDLRQVAEYGRRAREELSRRAVWDGKRSAAMYGWNVNDRDRKKWADRVEKVSQS